MASKQEEERVEAAKQSAADMSDANGGKEVEIETKMEADQPQRQQERPGVIGSVLKAVADTYEHAKEAVIGKGHEAAESAKEGAGSLVEKARETKDTVAETTKDSEERTAEKARETKDSVVKKLVETKEAVEAKLGRNEESDIAKGREAKGSVTEKVKRSEDSAVQEAEKIKELAAEKAGEGKERSASKLGELKGTSEDAATKATAFLSGMKEEAKESAMDTAEGFKEKLGDIEEAATGKMEKLKLEDKQGDERRDQKAGDPKSSEVEIGSEGKENVKGRGTMHELKESLQSKFVQEHGGTAKLDEESVTRLGAGPKS